MQLTFLYQHKRIKREEERLTTYNPFCPNMLMFGVCHSQYTCSFRHLLIKFDRPRDNIPRNGDIKFEIMTTHSPAHFTVRLLEHRPLRRNWQKIPYVDSYFTFEGELLKYYRNKANHTIHSPPELNDLCVIDADVDDYRRCKIIAIDRKKRVYYFHLILIIEIIFLIKLILDRH